MKIRFWNQWIGNSMKPGGAFPIEFLGLYVDINPSYRYLCITVLNFSIEVSFKRFLIEDEEPRYPHNDHYSGEEI